MRFYRIENSQKRGCYAGADKKIINPTVSNRHPMPFDDSLLSKNLKRNIENTFTGKVRFGFRTIEQFRTWFYDDADLQVLIENGYSLNVYDVPEVIKGNSQCVIRSEYHTPDRLKKSIHLSKFILTNKHESIDCTLDKGE